MAFAYHGEEHEIVWESQIVRYWFLSNVEVKERRKFGEVVRIGIGDKVRLSKAEARKVAKDGYYIYKGGNWVSDAPNGWKTFETQVYGTLIKQVETRQLRNAAIAPDEFVPPSKRKKLTVTPTPATVPLTSNEEATNED